MINQANSITPEKNPIHPILVKPAFIIANKKIIRPEFCFLKGFINDILLHPIFAACPKNGNIQPI